MGHAAMAEEQQAKGERQLGRQAAARWYHINAWGGTRV